VNSFTAWVFLITSISLAATSWIQSGKVSWATDKCGCIGVWGLGMSSVVMLGALATGRYVVDAAAWQILSFAVWMVCRAARREHWLNGVLGHTDRAPLSKE
jgi:hypothetical protein